MDYLEVNFDGLVGPTHNYAGLSHGNLASASHRNWTSHPREAALQGLEKMWFLASRGLLQAVLPPLARPALPFLRALGFEGSDADILVKVGTRHPDLIASASSASSMWAANAATVAPSPDTGDGRLHLTPANLVTNLHRSLEAADTHRVLGALFGNQRYFSVNHPLPSQPALADEGAANHTRLAEAPELPGLHLFVYGRDENDATGIGPRRFPARQSLAACQALARLHRLPEEAVLFLRQSPAAIDGGVFHNDVISTGHGSLFFAHEGAFADGPRDFDRLVTAYGRRTGRPLRLVIVKESDLPLTEVVRTYLFNSQIVTQPDGRVLLLAPRQCAESPAVQALLQRLREEPSSPFHETHFFNLQESMRNGGGPACLRLRVVMSAAERAAVAARVFLDEELHSFLRAWVIRHYRENLTPPDLGDPALWQEVQTALDELTRILRLGSIYPFQQA